MIKTINLKEFSPSVDMALATVEIEIEQAAAQGITVLKVLHGYGSHGRGGAIFIQLRKRLALLKKQGKILDYFGGDNWNLFSERTVFALSRDKSISSDDDLNRSNPGITIIVLK